MAGFQSRSGIVHFLAIWCNGFYQDRRLAQANLARGYGGDAQGSTTYEKGLTWALVGAGGG